MGPRELCAPAAAVLLTACPAGEPSPDAANEASSDVSSAANTTQLELLEEQIDAFRAPSGRLCELIAEVDHAPDVAYWRGSDDSAFVAFTVAADLAGGDVFVECGYESDLTDEEAAAAEKRPGWEAYVAAHPAVSARRADFSSLKVCWELPWGDEESLCYLDSREPFSFFGGRSRLEIDGEVDASGWYGSEEDFGTVRVQESGPFTSVPAWDLVQQPGFCLGQAHRTLDAQVWFGSWVSELAALEAEDFNAR